MTDEPARDDPTPAACGGCPLHDALHDAGDASTTIQRRDFLRAGAIALGSLGLFGLGAREAKALPVRGVAALPTRGGDRRAEKRYPFPATDGVSIDRDNSVIVARAQNRVYAFSLACPHQNTALRWSDDEHEFQCPKHHSHYRADGAFIAGRATRNMDRLVARRDEAALVVDVDSLIQQDEHPEQWAAAFVPG
jgi:nitrite reductase/ring-hydroxylating ferredoxin subunit